MSVENTTRPYVRIDAVAKYFDVSTSTVRSWVKEGRIPASSYIKNGRTYRFRLPEVENALLGAGEEDKKDTQMNLDFTGDAA